MPNESVTDAQNKPTHLVLGIIKPELEAKTTADSEIKDLKEKLDGHGKQLEELKAEYKAKIVEITEKTHKTQELTHLGFIVLIVTAAGMVSAGFFSFVEIFGEEKKPAPVMLVPVRGAPLCPLRE